MAASAFLFNKVQGIERQKATAQDAQMAQLPLGFDTYRSKRRT
jgi:hypothetical protein